MYKYSRLPVCVRKLLQTWRHPNARCLRRDRPRGRGLQVSAHWPSLRPREVPCSRVPGTRCDIFGAVRLLPRAVGALPLSTHRTSPVAFLVFPPGCHWVSWTLSKPALLTALETDTLSCPFPRGLARSPSFTWCSLAALSSGCRTVSQGHHKLASNFGMGWSPAEEEGDEFACPEPWAGRWGPSHLLTGPLPVPTDGILSFLKSSKPGDALCVLGLTLSDLYPQEAWTFTFGKFLPGHGESEPGAGALTF